jgi:hypothetical protein
MASLLFLFGVFGIVDAVWLHVLPPMIWGYHKWLWIGGSLVLGALLSALQSSGREREESVVIVVRK